MCTAITFQSGSFYFGRTLDHTFSYGQGVTITPRNFPLHFRHTRTLDRHYAIIGMALEMDGYPLYFDAVNEKGLAIAGLNFVGNAHYFPPVEGKDNIAHFELIPWLLGQCASVEEAKILLNRLNLTDTPFSNALPPAQLHWLLADQEEAVTIECTREGLKIFPNPVGVLTNNPPFDRQLARLEEYMHLSPRPPHNHFSDQLMLIPSSHGMGALGLPGDLSSRSRFIRAAFTKTNALPAEEELERVGQFFHILGTVEMVKGCCIIEDGAYECTIYTSCCNTDLGIYYYTTYENRQITAVQLHSRNLEEKELDTYPLVLRQQIRPEN